MIAQGGHAVTWMPVTAVLPKSTGTRSGCLWAIASSTRRRLGVIVGDASRIVIEVSPPNGFLFIQAIGAGGRVNEMAGATDRFAECRFRSVLPEDGCSCSFARRDSAAMIETETSGTGTTNLSGFTLARALT